MNAPILFWHYFWTFPEIVRVSLYFIQLEQYYNTYIHGFNNTQNNRAQPFPTKGKFLICADGAKQPLLTLKLICDSYCRNICNYVENLMMHIAGAISSSVLHPENLYTFSDLWGTHGWVIWIIQQTVRPVPPQIAFGIVYRRRGLPLFNLIRGYTTV